MDLVADIHPMPFKTWSFQEKVNIVRIGCQTFAPTHMAETQPEGLKYF